MKNASKMGHRVCAISITLFHLRYERMYAW